VTVEIELLSVADRSYLAGLKPHSAADLAEDFDGQVIEVRDGDTLSILVDGQQLEVSLQGIEAPELGQDCGPKSRERLARLVLGQEVHGRWSENRKGSVRACHLWVKGNRTELSKLMLQSGLAWRNQLANSNPEFQHAQIEAKMARIGVWAAADQVAPWDWRGLSELQRNQFQKQLGAKTSLLAAQNVAKPPLVAKPKVARSTGRNNSSGRKRFYSDYSVIAQRTWHSYWLNTNSRVRHNPSCHWFGNTNSGNYCEANAGRACKLCGGAP
jgi:micrococcal nuclease